jgi:SpoVK/Ycf46/Vps4 family AAA+-type ATPase
MDKETSPRAANNSRNIAAEKIVKDALVKVAKSVRWGNHAEVAQIITTATLELQPLDDKLAQRLQNAFPLEAVPVRTAPLDLVSIKPPSVSLKDVVLGPQIYVMLLQVLSEYARRTDLQRYDLNPRHRMLVSGPPGCGKTMLAEAMAAELDVSFLSIRYSGLLDSLLGGTLKKIDQAFEFASAAPCVLFFDEFDSVGQSRGQGNDVGEVRRITNHLLMLIERLPAHVFFIAATNEPSLIDVALKRRFDIHLELNAPTAAMKLKCAQMALREDITPGLHLRDEVVRDLANTFSMVSLHDIVQGAKSIRRQLALDALPWVAIHEQSR